MTDGIGVLLCSTSIASNAAASAQPLFWNVCIFKLAHDGNDLLKLCHSLGRRQNVKAEKMYISFMITWNLKFTEVFSAILHYVLSLSLCHSVYASKMYVVKLVFLG